MAKTRTNLYVEDGVFDLVKQIKKSTGRTMTAIIEAAIERYYASVTADAKKVVGYMKIIPKQDAICAGCGKMASYAELVCVADSNPDTRCATGDVQIGRLLCEICAA